MPLEITALYGALLTLVSVVLTSRVVAQRLRIKVSLGDGGDPAMTRANRRHLNWVEGVPVLITLLAVAELNGAPANWLHALGGTLLFGRIVHPFGIDMAPGFRWQRFTGALLTLVVTLGLIGTLLWQYFV